MNERHSTMMVNRLQKFVKPVRCICGHGLVIHGDYGCEGILTGFEGAAGADPMPCECRGYKREVRE